MDGGYRSLGPHGALHTRWGSRGASQLQPHTGRLHLPGSGLLSLRRAKKGKPRVVTRPGRKRRRGQKGSEALETNHTQGQPRPEKGRLAPSPWYVATMYLPAPVGRSGAPAQASLRAPWVGAQGREGPGSRKRASWSPHTPGGTGVPLVPSLKVWRWGREEPETERQRDRASPPSEPRDSWSLGSWNEQVWSASLAQTADEKTDRPGLHVSSSTLSVTSGVPGALPPTILTSVPPTWVPLA